MDRMAFIICFLLTTSVWGNVPDFTIIPKIIPPAQLYKKDIGTATYQITNNTQNTLSLQVNPLGKGVRLIMDAGLSYCSVMKMGNYNLIINPMSSCLIKLEINAAKVEGNLLQGGPVICLNTDGNSCNTPITSALNLAIINADHPPACMDNVANFNHELAQNMDNIALPPIGNWGPRPNTLHLNNGQPNLLNCVQQDSASSIDWQQKRILAAADFWINQKLNYCHHYLPDWFNANPSIPANKGGYCSIAKNLVAESPYFQQAIRWNYSGADAETAANWTNSAMWYGMDCSNYTKFIYNFGLGIEFTGNVQWQAGQKFNHFTSPNEQLVNGVLDNIIAPGKLVCADGIHLDDGTTAPCQGNGFDNNNPFFSTINANGERSLQLGDRLQNLKPGDLLFIAGAGGKSRLVTHVVIWTGKKVGNGPDDVPASKIAPNSICPQQWQPQKGQWVITDSHYQGADYRVMTPCFYLHNLWGVRRIIGNN